MNTEYTQGSIIKSLLKFSIPYLIACFLQSFYGMADLFITGQFYQENVITAVANGSQIMHFITVVIVGLSMGTTVIISKNIGSGNKKDIEKNIGNTITIFLIVSVIMVALFLVCQNGIITILRVPKDSIIETKRYFTVCILGITFIVMYNVLSAIFRGLGDTKTPLIFVAISGVFNIALDYILIGSLDMAAFGAAIATVSSQIISVILFIFYILIYRKDIRVSLNDLRLDNKISASILRIGIPIAFQEGFIQVSFLVISAIANMRGTEIAAAVGIVEKIISFVFLGPSAMLSTVSALASQNIGAGNIKRSRQILKYAIIICVIFGGVISLICNISPQGIVGLFSKKSQMVSLYGGQYLRFYIMDCLMAGIHFCFSGYFSSCDKAFYSFIHNMLSVLLIRIPGAYLAWKLVPDNLMPMGAAALCGSTFSVVLCVCFYIHIQRSLNAQKI